MHTTTNPLPAPDRTDVTFSEWRVADPARLHAAMDAWEPFPWPDGLLSHTCLAAEDHTTLRHIGKPMVRCRSRRADHVPTSTTAPPKRRVNAAAAPHLRDGGRLATERAAASDVMRCGIAARLRTPDIALMGDDVSRHLVPSPRTAPS